jgi:hypothetical protein
MMRTPVLLLLTSSLLAADQTPAADLTAPIPARQSYRLVFSDDFDNASTIGASPAEAPGAKWFRSYFFGEPVTAPSALSLSRGVLTMVGTAAHRASIQTAAPAPGPAGWGGRVFRNGAYFEARIALGPDELATPTAWPAFWSMAIEHMAQRGAARWSGQPADFMRFIENDFFEYNPPWGRNSYIATIQEWYGTWQSCGAGLWCKQSNADDPRHYVRLPSGQSWRDFHVYGQVWVPSTASAAGYIQNYMDGRAVGPRVEWARGDPSPPSAGRFRYNIIDRQGLVVILTTGGQPMMVDWVRVWQLPSGTVERR